MFSRDDERKIEEIMIYVPFTINISMLIVGMMQTLMWLFGPITLYSLINALIMMSYLGYMYRFGWSIICWYVVKYL